MGILRKEYPTGSNYQENQLIFECKEVARQNARNMAIALGVVAIGAYFLGMFEGKRQSNSK